MAFPNERVLELGTGFVACLDSQTFEPKWVVRLPSVRDLRLHEATQDVFLRTDSQLFRLRADGTAFVWRGAVLDGISIDFAVSASGETAVLTNVSTLTQFETDGVTQRFRVPVERSTPRSVTFELDGGALLVSGHDLIRSQADGGGTPYRSPFLFRFGPAGQRQRLMFDWGTRVTEGGRNLIADSYFPLVRAVEPGVVLVAGQAQNSRTVWQRSAVDLDRPQAALEQSCVPNMCSGSIGTFPSSRGAIVGRLTPSLTELERASFHLAFLSDGGGIPPSPCECPSFGSLNAVEIGHLTAIPEGVLAAGVAFSRIPEVASWFEPTIYSGSGMGFVALFDRDFITLPLSTYIPGTNGVEAVAVRGDLAAFVGSARDPAIIAQAVGPRLGVFSLPVGGSFQAGYGGGDTDGYLLLACLRNCPIERDAGTATGDAGVSNAGTQPLRVGGNCSMPGAETSFASAALGVAVFARRRRVVR
jgi:hypothetical protein